MHALIKGGTNKDSRRNNLRRSSDDDDLIDDKTTSYSESGIGDRCCLKVGDK